MKPALIAVLASLVFATHATAADRVWVDEWCMSSLTDKSDLKFRYSKTDGTSEMDCQIVDWPISSPVAEMACGTTKATLELTEDGSAIFNGVVMHLAGDKRVLCD